MTGTEPQRLGTPYPWTAAPPGFGFTTGTPWEPFSDGAETANLASEAADLTSVWATYRDLVQLRTQEPALRAGDFVRLKASNPAVAAWLRVVGDQRILVLHNLDREPATGVALDLAEGPLCGSPGALFVYARTEGDDELAEPASPTVTSSGGLAGYVPLPVIPAGASAVIKLVDGLSTTGP